MPKSAKERQRAPKSAIAQLIHSFDSYLTMTMRYFDRFGVNVSVFFVVVVVVLDARN